MPGKGKTCRYKTHSSKWWFDGDLPYGRIREKSPNKQIQVYGHKLGHILLWPHTHTLGKIIQLGCFIFCTPIVLHVFAQHRTKHDSSLLSIRLRNRISCVWTHWEPSPSSALLLPWLRGNKGSNWNLTTKPCLSNPTNTCSFQHSIMEHCHSTYRVVGSKYHKGILLHFWFEIWSFLAADLPCWVGAVG